MKLPPAVRQRWDALEAWLDALQTRERVLVVAAACGVLVALWDTLLLRPLEGEVRNLRGEVSAVTEATEALRAQTALRAAELSDGGCARTETERPNMTKPQAVARSPAANETGLIERRSFNGVPQ